MVKELARTSAPRKKGTAPASAWAYFKDEFVPIADAKVSVMTHALNYGTGVFEGIRAYWSREDEELYALHLKSHFERLHRSCRVMRLELWHSVEELCALTVELLRRCGYREDAYVRPLAYKSSELIGVRLHDLDDAFTMFAVPFGNYVDIDRGLSVGVSSWRRLDDNAIPARSKITGSYVNTALAKTDAQQAGFDEAIFLTQDGHVSEGSAENLFMVRDGVLVTPPVTDGILEGITRRSVLTIAQAEGFEVKERSIDRTELYIADEVFLCGTGAQISAVTSVDHRPVGAGEIGETTKHISRVYFEAVRGRDARYRSWLTPVYSR